MFLAFNSTKYHTFIKDFFFFGISSTKPKNVQKWVKMAKNGKNKTTLFYQTKKVEIVKVVLFFNFGDFFSVFII